MIAEKNNDVFSCILKCGIRTIRTSKPHTMKYCVAIEVHREDECPCRNCLLFASCSKVCEDRIRLREKCLNSLRSSQWREPS